MPHVIVTGGPGAGKTTLLAELAVRGYSTVDESARAIIAERLARGESPRPDPVAFAREILHRDIEKYVNRRRTSEWVFFDRGLIEAIGMLHEASLSSALRRPGKVVSDRVSDVRGAASASTKNGRPASASISAPCRDNDARDHAELVTIAGSAMRR